jgi:hypothetical protein
MIHEPKAAAIATLGVDTIIIGFLRVTAKHTHPATYPNYHCSLL